MPRTARESPVTVRSFMFMLLEPMAGIDHLPLCIIYFQAHGMRVGSFVSPMVSVRQDLYWQPALFQTMIFQNYLQKVWLGAEIAARYEPFRYFEVMVLIMFSLYLINNPMLALVGWASEGFGGRQCGTSPKRYHLHRHGPSGFTRLDFKGNSRAESRDYQKKKNVPVVLGPLSPETTAICRQIALDNQAPVYQFGQGIHL